MVRRATRWGGAWVAAAAILATTALMTPPTSAQEDDAPGLESSEGAPEVRLDVPTSAAFDPLGDARSDAAAPGPTATLTPWTELPDLPGPVFDNRFGLYYTLGGSDGTDLPLEMWWYSDSSQQWETWFGLPRRRQAPAIGLNRWSEMIMAGGWDENGEPAASVHYYDDASSWDWWLEEMPSARAAAGYASFTADAALYVVGGCTTAECAPVSDSVFVLEGWHSSWSSAADYPLAVAFPSCGSWKERIYCTGGYDGTTGVSASFVYDRATDRWSPLPDPPVDSWGAQHAMVDGILMVSGGVQAGAVTNNTFGYDAKSGSWVDLPNPSAARYRGAAGCIEFGNEPPELISAGGLNGTGSPLADAERLEGITECGDEGAGIPRVTRLAGENRYGTAATIAEEYSSPQDTVFLTTGESFPDALAASARAGSLGAPLLLTTHDGLREETREALERLAPPEVVVVGGEGAVEKTVLELVEDTVGPGTTRRLAGADRYGTAAAVAAEVETADTVFVATGADFPDALAGSALAGALDVPLLLTRQNRLPTSTRAQLERLAPQRIVVLGGEGVVSRSVANELAGYGTVDRVAGDDRWETAALVAAEFDDADPVGVASGRNWPDAVAGAARAADLEAPVGLVDVKDIPPPTREQLRRLGPLDIEIYGGRGAVSIDVFRALRALYD